MNPQLLATGSSDVLYGSVDSDALYGSVCFVYVGFIHRIKYKRVPY